MEVFLSSPIFLYGVFPLGSAVLGIGVKYATRNDQFSKFRKEDVAIGLELMMTAALMFVLLTSDRAATLVSLNDQIAKALTMTPLPPETAVLQLEARELTDFMTTSGWLIAAMVFGLWSVSTIVRKWGWRSETEMTPAVGIALPLALGVLSLMVVAAGAVQ